MNQQQLMVIPFIKWQRGGLWPAHTATGGRNLGRYGGGRGRQPGRGPLTPTSLLLAEPAFYKGSAKPFKMKADSFI